MDAHLTWTLRSTHIATSSFICSRLLCLLLMAEHCWLMPLLCVLALQPVQLPEELSAGAQLSCLNVQVLGCAQIQVTEADLAAHTSVHQPLVRRGSKDGTNDQIVLEGA